MDRLVECATSAEPILRRQIVDEIYLRCFPSASD
jgi:hypothetical protein